MYYALYFLENQNLLIFIITGLRVFQRDFAWRLTGRWNWWTCCFATVLSLDRVTIFRAGANIITFVPVVWSWAFMVTFSRGWASSFCPLIVRFLVEECSLWQEPLQAESHWKQKGYLRRHWKWLYLDDNINAILDNNGMRDLSTFADPMWHLSQKMIF